MSGLREACARLHDLARSRPRWRPPFEKSQLPPDGLYLVFERGEQAHGGDRIVRVGSHTGSGTLPSRLTEHFVRENKDRSIFRKNIGRALLSRDRDPYAEVWENDMTSRVARESPPPGYDPERQQEIESGVTQYFRANFSFAVIPMPDLQERREFERKISSLLFTCPECSPSGSWVGRHSPKELIRESGLWQVNGLKDAAISLGEIEELWL